MESSSKICFLSNFETNFKKYALIISDLREFSSPLEGHSGLVKHFSPLSPGTLCGDIFLNKWKELGVREQKILLLGRPLDAVPRLTGQSTLLDPAAPLQVF